MGTLLSMPALEHTAQGRPFLVMHLQCTANRPARRVVVAGDSAEQLHSQLQPGAVLMVEGRQRRRRIDGELRESLAADFATVLRYVARVVGRSYGPLGELLPAAQPSVSR